VGHQLGEFKGHGACLFSEKMNNIRLIKEFEDGSLKRR